MKNGNSLQVDDLVLDAWPFMPRSNLTKYLSKKPNLTKNNTFIKNVYKTDKG